MTGMFADDSDEESDDDWMNFKKPVPKKNDKKP